MKAKEYSLREKKHAKTKIAIMNAFMERLKHSCFDDISIREVCKDAEVAEGTFFNYFPVKIEVIGYYLHLTTIKIIWKAQKETSAGKYLSLIDSAFHQLSEELSNNDLAYQIFSVLLAQSKRPKKLAVSALEKRLAFPDRPGIEETRSAVLDEWFKECVISAQKNGEMPLETNVDDVVVSLITIITGTLLAVRFKDINSRGYHYMRQLRDLWLVLGTNEQKLHCGKDIIL
jgi:AcrR family transcriptional regulator